jgi:hypothetical protein
VETALSFLVQYLVGQLISKVSEWVYDLHFSFTFPLCLIYLEMNFTSVSFTDDERLYFIL